MNLRNHSVKKQLRQQLPAVTAFAYWLLFVQAWWQNKNILLIIGCFAGYVVFSVLTGRKRSSGHGRSRAGSVRRGAQTVGYDDLDEERRLEMDRQLELERQREYDRELERQREYDRERERERQREYERRHDDY